MSRGLFLEPYELWANVASRCESLGAAETTAMVADDRAVRADDDPVGVDVDLHRSPSARGVRRDSGIEPDQQAK